MVGLAQGAQEDFDSTLLNKVFVVVESGIVDGVFGAEAEVIDLDDVEGDPIRLWEGLSDEAKLLLEREYPTQFVDLRAAYNEAMGNGWD